jgi:hypothetical protein
MPASPTSADYVAEYTKLHDEYNARFPHMVAKLSYHISDNIIGATMVKYFTTKGIQLQVVPPDDRLHRRNNAERAVQTGKAHIISAIATCNKKFPIDAVHLILPQCELTLNLMRESDIKGVSCWERLRGPFDTSRHSIYPIGTSCAIYNPKHLTWAPRADPGFYLGANLLGFQSHRVFSTTTMAERDTVTLDWFPDQDQEALHYLPLPAHLFIGDIIPDVAHDYLPAAAPIVPAINAHPPGAVPEGDPPVPAAAPSTPRKANSEGDPPVQPTPHGPFPEGGPPGRPGVLDTPPAHGPEDNPPSHSPAPDLEADFGSGINFER